MKYYNFRSIVQFRNICKQIKMEAEKAEDVLRSLASFVGAGGYNADTVDADVFEEKIRWGIGQIMERMEKAEAELARLRAAPNEIGLGKGEFVIWPVKINGVHGLAFVKTDDPKVVGTSHAEPEDGQIELGAGDSAIYFGNAESAMVLAERLQYVISLMTGSDAAPVPAVAAPAVPDGDDFNGSTPHLIQCMEALVRLDADGVLVPHGIGRDASKLLSAAANRLRQQAASSVPEEWRKVMVELADDLAIEIDENYPPERRVYPSEQRRYEGEMEIVNRARALLQPAPQAPTVPDGRVSQDESTLTMAASALALFRAGESAEYMAKAIEALLQSAEVRHD